MQRTSWVLLGAAAACGLFLALVTTSPGAAGPTAITTTPPTSSGGQPSSGPGGPCTPPGATVFPTGDAYPQAAGTTFHHASCGWYPRTTCTNRVQFTLTTAAGKSYDLGSLAPEEYAVGIGLAPPFVKPIMDSPVIGTLTIPEQVNLTPAKVEATMAGKQTLDFGFPVLGCVDIAKANGRQIKLTVTQAASDSSAITGVQPVDGTVLKQGDQLQLRWTLSRAGEVQIRVFFELTPGRELSVRPGEPADSVLDAQRPAGANQFTLPLADSAGRSFPVGRYRFEIRLLDPAGSTLTPAKPKSATFDLVLVP